MGIEQHIAQATNIVFIIPVAVISILMNIKYKIIKWKVAVPVILCGVLGSIIGAEISVRVDSTNLKRYFGIFLGLIAIYEIYYLYKEYKNKKTSNNNN